MGLCAVVTPRKPPVRHLFESQIERYLGDKVEAAGGLAYKFTSPNRRNVPDRIVLLPGRPAQFVELKAPGKKPTAAQMREHRRFQAAGSTVWVLDTPEGVDHFMECMA